MEKSRAGRWEGVQDVAENVALSHIFPEACSQSTVFREPSKGPGLD